MSCFGTVTNVLGNGPVELARRASSIRDRRRAMKARARWQKAIFYANRQVDLNRTLEAARANNGEVLDEIETKIVQEIGTRTWPLIDPDASFKSTWDVAQCVLLIYIAFSVPIRVAFNSNAFGIFAYVESAIDAFFLTDLVMNFFTAYYAEDGDLLLLVVSKWKIAKNYLTSWFLCDFLAILPVDYIQTIVQDTFVCSYYLEGCQAEKSSSKKDSNYQLLSMFKVLRIFRLLKLLRLSRLTRMIDKYRDRFIYLQTSLSAFKMASAILFISHLFGCMYGAYFDWSEWMVDTNDTSGTLSTGEKYSTSFYWAVQTITTVGYGDLSARNTMDRLISILTMLFGGFVFSWIISNMNTMLNPDSSEKRFKDRETFILDFMKSNHLPREMASRFLSFYRIQNKSALNDKNVLNGVPYLVKAEIFEHMYWSALESVKFIRNTNRAFVTAVCMHLQELRIPAKRLLYLRGEIAQELFIVHSGKAAIIAIKPVKSGDGDKQDPKEAAEAWDLQDPTSLDDMKFGLTAYEQSNRALMNIGKGGFMGEDALLGILQRTYSVLAVSRMSILTLSRSSWVNLVQLCPNANHALLETYLARINRLALMDRGIDIQHLVEKLRLRHLYDPATGVLRDKWRSMVVVPKKGGAEASAPATPRAKARTDTRSPRYSVWNQNEEIIPFGAEGGDIVAEAGAAEKGRDGAGPHPEGKEARRSTEPGRPRARSERASSPEPAQEAAALGHSQSAPQANGVSWAGEDALGTGVEDEGQHLVRKTGRSPALKALRNLRMRAEKAVHGTEARLPPLQSHFLGYKPSKKEASVAAHALTGTLSSADSDWDPPPVPPSLVTAALADLSCPKPTTSLPPPLVVSSPLVSTPPEAEALEPPAPRGGGAPADEAVSARAVEVEGVELEPAGPSPAAAAGTTIVRFADSPRDPPKESPAGRKEEVRHGGSKGVGELSREVAEMKELLRVQSATTVQLQLQLQQAMLVIEQSSLETRQAMEELQATNLQLNESVQTVTSELENLQREPWMRSGF